MIIDKNLLPVSKMDNFNTDVDLPSHYISKIQIVCKMWIGLWCRVIDISELDKNSAGFHDDDLFEIGNMV